jgi:glycosyltransferase involved in cell wall biosynthesis
VVANAAVLVNPENVFEMMRALQRVLLDQALREKMRQRGYEQVKKFSWDRSAAEVLAGYEEVLGRHSMVVPVRQSEKIEPVKGAR